MEIQGANLADALKTAQFSKDGILTRAEYDSVLEGATSLSIPKWFVLDDTNSLEIVSDYGRV